MILRRWFTVIPYYIELRVMFIANIGKPNEAIQQIQQIQQTNIGKLRRQSDILEGVIFTAILAGSEDAI